MIDALTLRDGESDYLGKRLVQQPSFLFRVRYSTVILTWCLVMHLILVNSIVKLNNVSISQSQYLIFGYLWFFTLHFKCSVPVQSSSMDPRQVSVFQAKICNRHLVSYNKIETRLRYTPQLLFCNLWNVSCGHWCITYCIRFSEIVSWHEKLCFCRMENCLRNIWILYYV